MKDIEQDTDISKEEEEAIKQQAGNETGAAALREAEEEVN